MHTRHLALALVDPSHIHNNGQQGHVGVVLAFCTARTESCPPRYMAANACGTVHTFSAHPPEPYLVSSLCVLSQSGHKAGSSTSQGRRQGNRQRRICRLLSPNGMYLLLLHTNALRKALCFFLCFTGERQSWCNLFWSIC
jgi:hypothetical protein